MIKSMSNLKNIKISSELRYTNLFSTYNNISNNNPLHNNYIKVNNVDNDLNNYVSKVIANKKFNKKIIKTVKKEIIKIVKKEIDQAKQINKSNSKLDYLTNLEIEAKIRNIVKVEINKINELANNNLPNVYIGSSNEPQTKTNKPNEPNKPTLYDYNLMLMGAGLGMGIVGILLS